MNNKKLITFITDWLQAKAIENNSNHSYGYVIFLQDLDSLVKDMKKFLKKSDLVKWEFISPMVKNGERR